MISNIDIIYADPPWGGRDYIKFENLRLNMGNMSVENFICSCFDINKMITIPKLFVIKLPLNYDLVYFNECLNNKFSVYVHKLDKMQIMVIKLK